MGISRHTDAGALTILLQVARVNSDSTCYVDSSGDANSCDMTVDGGLEVYTGSKEDNADGQWVPVAPIANTLVINTGDMLQVKYS